MSEVAQSTNFLNMATEDEEHMTEEEAGILADLIVNAMRKKAREDREAEQEELAAVVNAADETSSASSSASSNSKRSREHAFKQGPCRRGADGHVDQWPQAGLLESAQAPCHATLRRNRYGAYERRGYNFYIQSQEPSAHGGPAHLHHDVTDGVLRG